MNPYVAVHFGFYLKSISDHFLVSIPVGESIIAKKFYRVFVVSIFHKKIMVGLIDLDTIDFDIILGIDYLTHLMLLWIVETTKSPFIFIMN